MKIIWLTNVPLTKVKNELNKKLIQFGGWLDGMSDGLLKEKNIEFYKRCDCSERPSGLRSGGVSSEICIRISTNSSVTVRSPAVIFSYRRCARAPLSRSCASSVSRTSEEERYNVCAESEERRESTGSGSVCSAVRSVSPAPTA